MEAYKVSRKFADIVIDCAIALNYGKADRIENMRDSGVEVVCFRKGVVYCRDISKRCEHNYIQIWNSLSCIIELADSNEGELNCKIYLGNNILDMKNVKVETDDSYLMIYVEGENGEHILDARFRIVN